MLEKNFTAYLLDSIKKNWEITALADYQGESFTYSQVGNYMIKFHQMFRLAGIEVGDKVAILGKNSARWGVLYLSIVSWGAVVVPVLPDFKKDDLMMIIEHSDAKLLFCDEASFKNLDISQLKNLFGVIKIEDFSLLLSG